MRQGYDREYDREYDIKLFEKSLSKTFIEEVLWLPRVEPISSNL